MMDLHALLALGRQHAQAMRLAEFFPFAAVPALRCFFGVLPGRAHGADGWDVVEPRAAAAKHWRLVVPVLAGPPADAAWMPAHPVTAIPTAETSRMESAIWGEHVLDLLAVDWSLKRPPRRLLGAASALGFGACGDDTAEGDEPVLLAADLADWLERLPHGPSLPLGDDAERAATIRRFGGGVVCGDLDHGMAVERLLRRPLPTLPKILVAA